jgi:hypothetical protein
MPRKKQHESQAKQSARFRSEVQKLIDAGELSPTEADEAFERALSAVAKARQGSLDVEKE